RFDGAEGTLGCVVRWKYAPSDLFILSNAHVLALTGSAPPVKGDAIVYPSREQGGIAPRDRIATLEWWTRFDAGVDYPNIADAAIAKILDTSAISPALQAVGLPIGVNENPAEGMRVK